MTDPDALRKLREHVDAAHDAAERIVREAGAPPRGWASAAAAEPEAQALKGLLAAVRDAVPPELARQLVEALRQLLLAVRALIDWYLERLDRSGPREPEVEDIPIE